MTFCILIIERERERERERKRERDFRRNEAEIVIQQLLNRLVQAHH
jgi:hypothetical protein